MKFDMDYTGIDRVFLDINAQYVTAGVLNKTLRTATPDYNQPPTMKVDTTGGGRSYQNNKIKAGKQNSLTVAKLAVILDADYGIISDVLENPNNKELIEIAKLFAIPVKTQNEINQLQNLTQALIKNPILRKDYGQNSLTTANEKGFNHVAINTGRLFRSIKAEYHKA